MDDHRQTKTAWSMVALGVLLIAFSFLAQVGLLDMLHLDLADQLPLAVALLGTVSVFIGLDVWRTHQQWAGLSLPDDDDLDRC